MHRFKVEAHRTSSNLLHLQPHRDSKVSRGFFTRLGWFDWTEPSLPTALQGIGVQGAICTGSGRLKHIEPHRTFSNYILTEIARYLEFFYMRSGWFDWTEPSPSTCPGTLDKRQHESR